MWAIRYPVNELINAVGHFKQTKNMSLLEAGLNLIISIVLIKKLGLLGVAIGTLIAMLIRGIYMIYYFSTNILKRNIKIDLKFIGIIVVETLVLTLIGGTFSTKIVLTNYVEWFLFACIYGIIATAFVIIVNVILNKKIAKEIINNLRKD